MDREPTPLVEGYRRYVADPVSAVGEWAGTPGRPAETRRLNPPSPPVRGPRFARSRERVHRSRFGPGVVPKAGRDMNQTDIPDSAGIPESEELFRLVVERPPTDYAIFTTDLGRRVITWNVGADRLIGFDGRRSSAASGRPASRPEDRDRGSTRGRGRRRSPTAGPRTSGGTSARTAPGSGGAAR